MIAFNADGTVLASAVPGEARPDVADLPGLSGAESSGFHLAAPVTAGDEVTIAGRRADGTLVPLDGVSNGVATVRPGTEVLVRGSLVPVAATSVGMVEQVEQVDVPARQRAARLTRPGPATDWNWLRLRAPRDLAAGRYTVGTPAGDGPIRFRLLSDARRSVDVMVGACNQWYDESDVMVVSYPAARSGSPRRAARLTRPGGRHSWWGRMGSNHRPRDYESPALTTELRPRSAVSIRRGAEIDSASRTPRLRARLAGSQGRITQRCTSRRSTRRTRTERTPEYP